MKKMKFTIIGLLVGLSLGVVNAQSSTNSNSAPAKQATTKKTTSKVKPASTNKTAASITGTTTAKPAQHLKKDGTPDMRYKENKAAAGKTTSKKASGAAATKSANPSTPAK